MSDILTWSPASDDDPSADITTTTTHNTLPGRSAAASHPAAAVAYDATASGLTGDTVQEAIDELEAEKVPTARTVTAGTGLTGGGDLSANRTLTVAYGSTAGTAAQGNDSRLSDARTPTAHAASHATGQSDAVAPGDIGAEAVGVAAARTQVGTLAGRPSATGLDDGVRYFATDDGGGTLWVVDSETWVQAAPPVEAGTLLAAAEPVAAETVVLSATSTPYRITGLTAAFTVPDRRVRIETAAVNCYEVVDNDIHPRISLRYSTDNWSTSTPISPAFGLAFTELFSGVIELNFFPPQSALLPVAVTAGTAIQVACFIQDNLETGSYIVGYNAAAGTRPYLAAYAV